MTNCGIHRVDLNKDSMVSAARKIGGIKYSESDFRAMFGKLSRGDYYQNIYWAPLIRKTGGLSADKMAQLLYELGYLYTADIDAMFNAMCDEINGNIVIFSWLGDYYEN